VLAPQSQRKSTTYERDVNNMCTYEYYTQNGLTKPFWSNAIHLLVSNS